MQILVQNKARKRAANRNADNKSICTPAAVSAMHRGTDVMFATHIQTATVAEPRNPDLHELLIDK